jgi:hypothetical protein
MTKQRSRSAYRSRNAARRPAAAGPAAAARPAVTPRPSVAAQREAAADKGDFSAEYHYVLSDLRRLGLLALAMFATLVVLALVIR